MPLPILTALQKIGTIAAAATTIPLLSDLPYAAETAVENSTKTTATPTGNMETTKGLTAVPEAADAAAKATSGAEAATALGMAAIAIGSIMSKASLTNGDKSSSDKEECTVAEAAKLLGLSEYTVKKKIREKELVGRIVGKKYMVSTESIQAYSKKAGKSGQILGAPASGEPTADDAMKNPNLLQKSIESAELQQEIISLEIEKLEISKKIAERSKDEDLVDRLKQQIINKKIQKLELSKQIKVFETQILYLKEYLNIEADNETEVEAHTAPDTAKDADMNI